MHGREAYLLLVHNIISFSSKRTLFGWFNHCFSLFFIPPLFKTYEIARAVFFFNFLFYYFILFH